MARVRVVGLRAAAEGYRVSTADRSSAAFAILDAMSSARAEAYEDPRRPELGGYTEDDLVMANYQTTFVGKGGYVDTHFDEIYVF